MFQLWRQNIWPNDTQGHVLKTFYGIYCIHILRLEYGHNDTQRNDTRHDDSQYNNKNKAIDASLYMVRGNTEAFWS